MDRYSITFQVVPVLSDDSRFHVTSLLMKWHDNKIVATDVIVDRYMDDVQNLQGNDVLAWAQHVIDEMYKTVNAARAEKLDGGWISGACVSEPEASKIVTDEG